MVAVLMFHHALGRTDGVLAFADELRSHGHEVEVPDLFAGATFASIDAGVAHAEEIGFDEIIARGVAAAASQPDDLVYAGFSLGVLPAQKLVQTRPRARGALFYHSAVPPDTFGTAWPGGVPLQIHVMEADSWGDVDVAEEVARTVDAATLYLYPGSEHLFTDSCFHEHDAEATRLVLERTLALLDSVG